MNDIAETLSGPAVTSFNGMPLKGPSRTGAAKAHGIFKHCYLGGGEFGLYYFVASQALRETGGAGCVINRMRNEIRA